MNLKQIKELKSPNLTIPGLHDLELYPFQKIGVIAISECPRIIIGDQVGLGKSIQSISAIQLLHNLNHLSSKDCLIICPNPTKKQWFNFLKKHTVLSPLIGDSSDDTCSYLKSRFNVLIIGFNTIRMRIDILDKHPFKMLIVDEGLFKNGEGKTFQALKRMANKVQRLIILNATPVENGLDELHSHIDLIKPNVFPKQRFMDMFCKTEKKFFKTKYKTNKIIEKIVGIKSVESLQQLKDAIGNFYIARRATDAGVDIPQPQIKDIWVDLKKSQKEEYLDQIKKFFDKENKQRVRPAQLLLNLLHICDGKLENWYGVDDPASISAKGTALVELVKSLGDQQFVLFSNYLDPLYASAKIVKNMGKRIGFFTGKQKEEDRQIHLDEFKEGKRDALFITRAAMRGLNLENCAYMIKLNQLYNPSANEQLEGRISRLSSKHKNVFIFNLLTRNTVEENIIELLKHKKDLATFMNLDNLELDNLNEEQLQGLLGTRESLIKKDNLKASKEIFENEVGISE